MNPKLAVKDSELVSVIMPTYNAGKYLAESIACILQQTHHQLELLITDDGSSDRETFSILQRYAVNDARVKVSYLKENRGAGYARNEAISRAKGRYIAFCDADDRWTEDKLEIQLAFMKTTGCAICCTSYLLCNSQYNPIGINIPPKRISFKMMKCDNKIGCLTAIYDVKKMGKKYLMPTIRKQEDWAMFLEITRDAGFACGYIDKPLAYYCVRNDSVSSDKFSLIRYNVAIYRNILKFSPLKAYFYFFYLFLPTYVLKKIKRKVDFMQYKRKTSVFI